MRNRRASPSASNAQIYGGRARFQPYFCAFGVTDDAVDDMEEPR
jgi:hypothetical protein